MFAELSKKKKKKKKYAVHIKDLKKKNVDFRFFQCHIGLAEEKTKKKNK